MIDWRYHLSTISRGTRYVGVFLAAVVGLGVIMLLITYLFASYPIVSALTLTAVAIYLIGELYR